jgi:hemerythrin
MTTTIFAWTPDLATGNALLDNQHKELFLAANALFAACQIGREKREIERTMSFLRDYTSRHFAAEEMLQKKYNYPEYLAHKRLHDDFTGVTRELAEKLSQAGPTDDLIGEVYTAIGEWLINHIRSEDIKMTAYIHSKAPTV